MNVSKPKDKRPLSLPELLKLNRNAVTIYTALRWMAGDKRQHNTVRKRIREVCHLSFEVITDAMRALKDANWLTFSYGQKEGTYFRWYRITFPQAEFFPVVKAQAVRPLHGKKPAQGRSPLEGENTSPLKERGPSDGSRPDRPSPSSTSGRSRADKASHGSPENGKVTGQIFVSEDGTRYVKLQSGALRPLDQNESPKAPEA